MERVRVIDACMGRGKSSAAIRYMNEHANEKRFLYITPYLDEVDRICDCCDFDQSDSDYMSKSKELKKNLIQGKNVSATHALFHLIDNSMLDIIRDKKYSLIIDESLDVIERIQMTAGDFKNITTNLSTIDDRGMVSWIDKEYTGKLSEYKELADKKNMYCLDGVMLNIMNPEMLTAFDEVVMLTYLFNGQYVRAYMDYFGIEYYVTGVEADDKGFKFSESTDNPDPIDYFEMIHIVNDDEMNCIGRSKWALSKNWYARKPYGDPDLVSLRKYLRKFFRKNESTNSSNKIMWTSFKSARDKVVDKKKKRFNSSFLQISARATNEYRDRNRVAYLANRFIDPNVTKWFANNGVELDQDEFALSEMLQWIWRSAIRDGKPIDIYIPSKRMRDMLIDWMNEMKNNNGDVNV